MNYTITLTDTQVKALEYVTDDPKNWITNAAEARAPRVYSYFCGSFAATVGIVST